MGDEGLTECAAKCDEQKDVCVAFSTSEAGQCSLLKSVNVSCQHLQIGSHVQLVTAVMTPAAGLYAGDCSITSLLQATSRNTVRYA